MVKSWLTLCDPMDCSMPGFSVHHYLHEFAQTHLHSVSDAIQPSHYLSPPSLSFIFSLASGSPFPMSQFFASGGEYWRFSFSISPSNEYSVLISFRIDWFDLLAVQGTLKSLLQYHSSKASILWHSAFFLVQLSHPYMTPEKTIALTIQTFVLFNVLSRFVIALLLS